MIEIDSDNIDDEILLAQLNDGSIEAFNILFDRYWQRAFSDAFKRLYNEDDAKDIVQEIFVYIWTNREVIHIQNFPAYLHIAVRNKVIKLLAKRKTTHPFYDLLDEAGQQASGADANLMWKEFAKEYESLVNSLPPKRKEIFRLRYQEDQSTNAIAERLGITRKTVQNQLGKAIETLKGALTGIFLFVVMLLISL